MLGIAHAESAALCVIAAEDAGFKLGPGRHEVWRAVVALRPRSGGAKLGMQPLHAELVGGARSSIAISPVAEAMRLGNATLPENLPLVYPSMGY